MVINDVDVGNGLMDFACVSDLEDYIAELRERAALAVLEARIEEAEWWIKDYWGSLEEVRLDAATRWSDYQAQRDKLKEAAK